MNIIFAENFLADFKQLDARLRVIIGQRVGYFSSYPTSTGYACCPVHVPGLAKSIAYMIKVSEKYRAVYYLIDDETALFTHLLAYEQPVVLPQEVQT